MQGWKTIIFGALVAALGAIQATDLANVIPAEWTGIAMTAIGAIVMILRTVTSTPVGKSTP